MIIWPQLILLFFVGQEWLSRTFSVTPRTGWAIDPFGHTSTMAYILKQMKFDNMLIQRVHYHVKKQLAYDQNLEFRYVKGTWGPDKLHESSVEYLTIQ